MNLRQLFLDHVGQTSATPVALHITRASGSRLFDAEGRSYIDLIAGISVCNVGHAHPAVVEAIREQTEKYLHIMVYGELMETPQILLARELVAHLPPSLNNVFFTCSGSEATEGAMKLAKRATGRGHIVSFQESYHGSTQGALSVMGSEYWRQAFHPLLPGIDRLTYGSFEELERITEDTACVIAETIQAEAGVRVPSAEWMKALRARCDETGALLVLDEIQCGFGRNGTLWAFEAFGIVPDILLLGKALGGGMPLGAFVADRSLMHQLTHQPVLGHINTFGGHPVSCAAGLAALQVLREEQLLAGVAAREALFRSLLRHPLISEVRSRGLMMAAHLPSPGICQRLIRELLTEGVFSDWFLFAPHALRIAPPLNITEEDIRISCEKIRTALDRIAAEPAG